MADGRLTIGGFSTAGALKDLDLDYQEAADLADAVGMEGTAFGRESFIGPTRASHSMH